MCIHGGLITRRHNDIRDLSVKDVCSNIYKEPTLQPLSGESLQRLSMMVLDWNLR